MSVYRCRRRSRQEQTVDGPPHGIRVVREGDYFVTTGRVVAKAPSLLPVSLSVSLLVSLLLTACVAPQTRVLTGMQAGDRDLPRQVELTAVPFFPQQSHQCGPAALATVLNDAGVRVSPQELVPQVYLPERKGSLQADMLAAGRRYGMVSYRLAPALVDVLDEVAGGVPVLVLQNLAFGWIPMWHYAVVVGYDLDQGEILLRSGRERRARMSLSTFERTWGRADFWSIVVLPPQRLPRSAREGPYVAAVVALEEAGQTAAARLGYQSALLRWPDNLAARIGVGNTYYNEGDLEGAVQAFREASLRHPESADAFNNLAQVLGELGEFEAARTAAYTAVRLGGSRSVVYRETLRQIEAHRTAP